VLAALLFYVVITLPLQRSVVYAGAILLFMALGAVPHLIRRMGFSWIGWTIGIMLIEVSILTYLLVVPPPFALGSWTPQLNLRLPNFLYLGVFLVGMALSYSPALVVWTGSATMAAWSAGVLWIANLPDSIAGSSLDILDRGMTPEQIIGRFLDAKYVGLTNWYNQLVFLALVTLILAITVWRSRRLVRRQVVAETARSNLSRYFSPNLVEELAGQAGDLDKVTTQKVAVLFADMVGFTAKTERMTPEALVKMLREFHGRLARTIFDHGGTLDKYMGDAVMAHFGTPRSRPDDASRALACGIAMVREVDLWNAERAARGEAAIAIGVGLHYGPVVSGNIGDEQRLEYTVLGDTVNVASRIEALTRELNSPLAVSDDLVSEIRQMNGDHDEGLVHLTRDRERPVRGREHPVMLWTLQPQSAQVANEP